MRCSLMLYLLLLPFFSLSALFIGNPAEPALLNQGIWTRSSWGAFRVGYLDDWVYQQRFRDEFKLEGVTHTRTHLKLSTYAGMATFNFKKRLDLYGIVGSSRLQIDEEIFTKRALSWSVGAKLVFLKHKNFFLGTDLKYFETNQKPKYFVVEGLPYNIVSNYRLKYKEIQAALGMSYRAWIFAPYINGTYILTHVDPEPAVVLVRLPDVNEIVDVESKSIICKKRWGAALGLTLIDSAKASLSFEWRFFNQNAINLNGEIQF
jgi:hypothetical protein